MAEESKGIQGLTPALILIGIGVLALTGYLWPGIFFVIGGALIIGGLAAGKNWSEMTGGLIMLAIGIYFVLPFNLNFSSIEWFGPAVLIIIGCVLLFRGLSGKR
jgi:hypothetical protein